MPLKGLCAAAVVALAAEHTPTAFELHAHEREQMQAARPSLVPAFVSRASPTEASSRS